MKETFVPGTLLYTCTIIQNYYFLTQLYFLLVKKFLMLKTVNWTDDKVDLQESCNTETIFKLNYFPKKTRAILTF